jgi:hypothetical protein
LERRGYVERFLSRLNLKTTLRGLLESRPVLTVCTDDQVDKRQTSSGEVGGDILLTILLIGYTSEAMIDAQWYRLNTQRPDQNWVDELLPDSSHAEHQRRTREPQYGALNGDLAILIGLIAFSSHAGYVERAVMQCIRPVDGQDGGWRTHGRPRAQGCRMNHSFDYL